MAQVLSGSFKTTAYGNRHLALYWSATQDINKNQSTISWTLKGEGTYSGYYKAGNFKVVIAGEVVYENANRISLYNGTVVASGTKVITHNTDGSKSFSASAQAGIYTYAVNCSGSGTWELKQIPRYASLTAAPNFNDEENPTVTYSNPSGNNVAKVELGIYKEDVSNSLAPYREVSKTGTSYTFSLTEAERANLRKYATGNTAKVKFYIKTTLNDGSAAAYFLTKTLTIINANPLVNMLMEEMDDDVLSITKDSKCFVKHKSFLGVTFNYLAQKGATVTNDGITITNSGESLHASINSNSVYFSYPTNSVVSCSVVDSRGNNTTVTTDLANNIYGYSWVPYVVPTCSMSVSLALANPTTSKATIKATGDFYNGAIGETANALTLNYGIWEDGNDSAVFTGVFEDVNINDNKYNGTVEVGGLNYQKTYKFKCWATDVLPDSTAYSDEMRLSTLPVFDWSRTDFNFNVPVKFNGDVMADFIIEQGVDSMGSNGTWYWQKWKSGKVECWGQRNYGNMAVNTAWGNLYKSADFTQSLPSGLFYLPPTTTSIQLVGSNGGAWVAQGFDNATNNTTSTCKFCIVRPVSGNITPTNLGFYLMGTWK